MFKILTLSIAFLSCSKLLLAQETTFIKTLLWEIKDPKSQNVSYIFGTNHLFGESWLDSITTVKEKFLKAKHILVEVNVQKDTVNLNLDSIKKPYQGPVILPRNIFTNKNFNILNNYTKSIKWGDIDTLFHDNPQPILTLMTLDWQLYTEYSSHFNIKTSAEDNMDEFFAKYANTNNKKISSLDDMYQITTNLLKKQSPEDLAKDIEDLVISLHDANLPLSKNYNEINEYKNLQYHYRFNEVAPDNDENGGLEVTLRNNRWMPKLINAFHQDNCFVAVGIGHLNYKNGLINQLKAAGFEVTPVEIKRIGLP